MSLSKTYIEELLVKSTTHANNHNKKQKILNISATTVPWQEISYINANVIQTPDIDLMLQNT